MTIDNILAKLRKRSESPAAAWNVWLARNYSLADLYRDLITVDEQQKGLEGERGS